jgi:enamine deaminase RidA (YjgF/YER057c/UK114 family)
MSHLEHMNPDGVAPPRATYSHAIRSRGDMLWLAGQVPTDAAGNVVGRGDAAAQTRQVVANIELVLDAAGAGWSDVVRLTVYVVGAENVAPVRALRSELWPELFHTGRYPTSTFVVVDRLASEDFLVEIEATAVLSRDSAEG